MSDQKDGWFSDIDEANGKWQPCLQLGGFCPSMPIWFRTKGECDEFIRDDIIGKGWDCGDDPTPPKKIPSDSDWTTIPPGNYETRPPNPPRVILPGNYTIDRSVAVRHNERRRLRFMPWPPW